MLQRPCRALVVLFALLLPLAGCHLTPPPPPAVEPASADILRQSIHYLASDELEGRGIETPGLDAAAQYIAGYFRGLGLKPAPRQDDFIHPFTTDAIVGLDPRTSLSTAAQSLQLNTDFAPLALSPGGSFKDAPIAFVGYALRTPSPSQGEGRGEGNDPPPTTRPASPDSPYNDFTGLDLHGKVALAMLSSPLDSKGQLRLTNLPPADKQIERKAALAAERGAVALLLVQPASFTGRDALLPFGPHIGPRSPIPVFHLTRPAADRLLREARAPSLKDLQSAIDAGFSSHSFILKRIRLSGTVAFRHTRPQLKNITARIPGRGPLADQYIVIGAHYDHLGQGGFASLAPTTRAIHPGADDNASGVGALLELARLFSEANRPARSLLFVAFSGEEQGLLGSQEWVRNPPVPLNRIVAMINLDMVGRVTSNVLYVGGQNTSPAFPPLLQEAEQSTKLRIRPSWPDGDAPSDSLPFLQRGIPVLLFFSGLHDDYHRPSDTPDRINYTGEAQTLDLIAKLLAQVTALPDQSLGGRRKAVKPPQSDPK